MNAVKRPYCSQIREESLLSLLANMHTFLKGAESTLSLLRGLGEGNQIGQLFVKLQIY
jgi:hypothetical protein